MFDSLTPDIQKKVNKYILHNEKKAIDIKDVMRSLHEDGEVIKGSRLGLSQIQKVVRRKLARIFDRNDWLLVKQVKDEWAAKIAKYKREGTLEEMIRAKPIQPIIQEVKASKNESKFGPLTMMEAMAKVKAENEPPSS